MTLKKLLGKRNVPDHDPYQDLTDELTALTEQLRSTADPKERADIAFRLAQARHELAKAREVQKRLDQRWWSGRHFEVLLGVAIAAAAVAAFFIQNLRPLIAADEQLALKNAEIAQKSAEIAEKQAQIQERETVLTKQENARVQGLLNLRNDDLQKALADLASLSTTVEERLSTAVAGREKEIELLKERLAGAQRQSAEAELLRTQLVGAERELELTRTAEAEAGAQTERILDLFPPNAKPGHCFARAPTAEGGEWEEVLCPMSLTRSNVRVLQAALHEAGYYLGAIDGVWGPETRSAVGSYAKEHNIAQNGENVPMELVETLNLKLGL